MQEFETAASFIESFAFQRVPDADTPRDAVDVSEVAHTNEDVEFRATPSPRECPDMSEFEYKPVVEAAAPTADERSPGREDDEGHKEEDFDLSKVWFVVFDTETTGISARDVVVQLCTLAYYRDGLVHHTYNELWKMPNGVVMNPRAEATHHISTTMLDATGLDARAELERTIRVYDAFLKHKIPIVAHNAAFDNRMLKQTAQRHDVRWPFEADQFFCTQRASRHHVKAKDKLGRIKAPSNLELYMHFESCHPDGNLHDALVDCRVTAVGFMGGSRAGWW